MYVLFWKSEICVEIGSRSIIIVHIFRRLQNVRWVRYWKLLRT